MKNKVIALVICVIIAIIAILGTLFGVHNYLMNAPQQVIDNYYNYSLPLLREYGTDDVLEVQTIMEERMNEEFDAGEYTAEDPYIVQNPYGRNGLSAYIKIPTEEAVKYTYTVVGKTDETNFTYSVEEFEQNPVLPVVALYNAYDNTIEVELETESGEKSEYTYTVRPELELEEYTSDGINIEIEDETAAEDTLYGNFVFDGRSNGYDSEGELRFTGLSTYRNVYMNPINGKFLVGYDRESYLPGEYFAHRVFEMNFMGRFNTEFQLVAPDGYGFHHDMIYSEETNKYYALLSYEDDEGTYNTEGYGEALIGIYDADTLKEEKVIDLTDQIPSDILVGPESVENDIHFNSIAYEADRNELIVSSRSAGALIGFDADSGEINWVLDNPDTIPEELQDVALTPTGDDMTFTHGQHSVYIRTNDKFQEYFDQGELVVTVFDNNFVQYNDDGTLKYSTLDGNEDSIALDKINPEGEGNSEEDYSRIVTYAINFDDNTFEVVEDYDLSHHADWTSNVYDVLDKYLITYIGDGHMEVLDFDGNELIDMSGLRGGYRGRIFSQQEITDFMTF